MPRVKQTISSETLKQDDLVTIPEKAIKITLLATASIKLHKVQKPLGENNSCNQPMFSELLKSKGKQCAQVDHLSTPPTEQGLQSNCHIL